jgi:hypothetical protein
VDLIWSLGARYCVRQDAHAFMWLWGLFLALAGAAVALRGRRASFGIPVLLFLAFCTAAVGFGIFYACYRWAPYSMGLSGPSISAADLNAFMCLSRDAVGTAGMWTVIVLACSTAVGLVAWARLRSRNAAIRAGCYIAAVLALLLAIAGGFLWFFGFSWCSSQRLF